MITRCQRRDIAILNEHLLRTRLSHIIGKNIITTDENGRQTKIKVINVQINNSLAGFKNTFFLISNKDAQNVKEGNEIAI